MSVATTTENLSPRFLKVVQRAKRDPQGPLRGLADLIDVDALGRAHGRLRGNAAVGVDGITKEQYGQKLDDNLRDLHGRMRAVRWRHQPIRRVHIPKGRGKTRPIGISTTEDKVVQGALHELLEALYEPVFLPCSYGFRPGRRAHEALRELDGALFRGEGSWVLEADIESFFDSIDRKMLMEMLRERADDRSLLRLVGKCLHVGVLEGEEYSEPVQGTVQGSVLSPLLGNVYLHHVLDLWFEREVQPRLRGKARLIRYADDFVIVFERREDAERVMAVLGKRFARYGLRLHRDKTRLVPFGPPGKDGVGQRPVTFDFLGFTWYWRRTRGGSWRPGVKTRKTSLRKAIMALADWCRSHRHQSVKEQHAALCIRINGHARYFAVNGNLDSIKRLVHRAERIWHKWLDRRGSPKPMTWARFKDLLRDYPLPVPRVQVQMWGAG
jgi:group II intron reverse transcriptase/maturase